jgi:hypothetical protein
MCSFAWSTRWGLDSHNLVFSIVLKTFSVLTVSVYFPETQHVGSFNLTNNTMKRNVCHVRKDEHSEVA